jgi:hypothetical protein
MCLITKWHDHLAVIVKAWMASQHVLLATAINTTAKATTKNNTPKATTTTTATVATTMTTAATATTPPTPLDDDIVSSNYMKRSNTSHHYSHFTERNHIHTMNYLIQKIDMNTYISQHIRDTYIM